MSESKKWREEEILVGIIMLPVSIAMLIIFALGYSIYKCVVFCIKHYNNNNNKIESVIQDQIEPGKSGSEPKLEEIVVISDVEDDNGDDNYKIETNDSQQQQPKINSLVPMPGEKLQPFASKFL